MPTESDQEALQAAIIEILRPHGGNVTTVFVALMKRGGFEWVEDGSPIYAAVTVLKKNGKVELAETSPYGLAWRLTQKDCTSASHPTQSGPAGPATTFND